ncbi:MAG: serine/threonine protein kinase [Steroidobacteraceae bacterium]
MANSINSTLWRELSPHLDRALELEDGPRGVWLAELRAGNPELAATLEKLLAESRALDSEGFLEGTPFPLLSHPSLAGHTLGPYTIDRLISRGGMGEVWLASRSDGRFEGHCAIKLFAGSVMHPKLADRFHHEGRLLGRLIHPHIARLLDAGTTETGRQYLVLEYVDGQQIDHYCESKALSVDARVRLFLDVVLAVAHAHSHLIIHRDLKPSNVLVTRDGSVKLLDFGIGKLLAADEQSQDDALLTRVEDAVLTPEYAAPEQLFGDAPSTATDVYQLGMLLYVLLAGRHPVSTCGSRSERIKAALDGHVPRISEFVNGPVSKQLRGDLDSILSMALRKDPNERYATAAALHEDLVRYLNGDAVHARAGAALYAARKFVNRHRASVLAALLVAVALLGAFAVTAVQLVETRRQRESALASARHAEATKTFLQLVLSEFQSHGEPLTSKALLERSSALLKAQYADQPAFVSEMLIELSIEYIDIAELTTALDMLEEARRFALLAGNYRLLARAECEIAGNQARSGLGKEAAPHLRQGMLALGRLQSADIQVRAACMFAQAKVRAASADRDGAIQIETQARTILEDAGETRSILYNTILSGLGSELMDEGRVAEALAFSRRVVDSNARNGRGGTRQQLVAEQNVATILYRLGEVRESYELRRQIQDQLAKLTHGGEVRTVFLANAAGCANRLARYDPALDLLPAAAVRAEQDGDLSMFRFISTELARTRLRMGSPRAEVEAPLDHLQATRVGGEPAFDTATRVLVDSIRAELDVREARPQAADRRAEQLLQTLNQLKFNRPRSKYLASSLASRTALAVGDPARAMEHARAALRVVEPIARGPDTSADVGDALLLLARALIAQHHEAEARPLLARAILCLRNGYGADHPTTREAETLISSQRG